MSKERELLKRCLDFMLDVGANLNPLFKEVNDVLLAQPEQEPVAWMQDSIELYVQESKDTIRGYVIPLYIKPVNKNIESLKEFLKKRCIRMPLSEYEITEECDSKGQEHISAFIDGIEFAEKMHGIGEDTTIEISKKLDCCDEYN